MAYPRPKSGRPRTYKLSRRNLQSPGGVAYPIFPQAPDYSNSEVGMRNSELKPAGAQFRIPNSEFQTSLPDGRGSDTFFLPSRVSVCYREASLNHATRRNHH